MTNLTIGGLPVLDLIITGAFFLVWWGYFAIADSQAQKRVSLASILFDSRKHWMARMLERDNRMPDVQIISAYIRTGALFISTTLLLLAGVLAVLGQIGSLIEVINSMPFGQPATARETQLRLVVVMVVLVYAFFRFSWCVRQFNYAMVMIGAAPMPGTASKQALEDFPTCGATVVGRAANNFNKGLRSYYFALGLIPWFFDPLWLVISMTWVVVSLYMKDFRSVTQVTLDHMNRNLLG